MTHRQRIHWQSFLKHAMRKSSVALYTPDTTEARLIIMACQDVVGRDREPNFYRVNEFRAKQATAQQLTADDRVLLKDNGSEPTPNR